MPGWVTLQCRRQTRLSPAEHFGMNSERRQTGQQLSEKTARTQFTEPPSWSIRATASQHWPGLKVRSLAPPEAPAPSVRTRTLPPNYVEEWDQGSPVGAGQGAS